LIATKVQVKGQNIEGYNVFIGGGVDDEKGLGRELYTNIPAEDAPALVTKAYKIYQDNRIQGETFVEFSRRNDTAQIRSYIEASSNIPA
jgi:ferredoxin-nitrite reductase